ncbi:MAG: translation initiation factor Sui1 [Desulfocapsa sp.]|nr:translation initiation factor Sui1 [Desulfocapsa sp.]
MARKTSKTHSALVYSTESGTLCAEWNKQAKHCSCPPKQSIPKDGIIRLMRETKGRKGKGVSLIHGLPLDPVELKKLAKALKKKCGSGGSIKNAVIEIQGDHRDVLEQELVRLGYKVKRAGG